MSARREKRLRQLEKRVEALEVDAALGYMHHHVGDFEPPKAKHKSRWQRFLDIFRKED